MPQPKLTPIKQNDPPTLNDLAAKRAIEGGEMAGRIIGAYYDELPKDMPEGLKEMLTKDFASAIHTKIREGMSK